MGNMKWSTNEQIHVDNEKAVLRAETNELKIYTAIYTNNESIPRHSPPVWMQL